MIDLILHSYSFYFIVIVVSFLIYQYFQVLKISRRKDDYGKVRVVSLLFGAFALMLGISSIFADVIFEFLGLKNSRVYETISLIAFTVLCCFSYLIMNVEIKYSKKSRNFESTFDYENPSFSNVQTNFNYQPPFSEKILEYLGLVSLYKRFDVDINLGQNESNSNVQVDTTVQLTEQPQHSIIQENSFELTDNKLIDENIYVDDIPRINIQEQEGTFDIDINLENILDGGE